MERHGFLGGVVTLQHRVHQVCGVLGPRQVGKTTLAKLYAKRYPNQREFDINYTSDDSIEAICL